MYVTLVFIITIFGVNNLNDIDEDIFFPVIILYLSINRYAFLL